MHVVVGDKNPDSALVGEAGHDGLNVFYRDGVYAGKGLVEQSVCAGNASGPLCSGQAA